MLFCRPKDQRLSAFVDYIWVSDEQGGRPSERILPNARSQILVNLSGNRIEERSINGAIFQVSGEIVMQGPRKRPVLITQSARDALCGVSFKPGGAHWFFGNAVSSFSDRLVDPDLDWGRTATELHHKLLELKSPKTRIMLLEATLLERAFHRLVADGRLEWACNSLAQGMPVFRAAEELGFNARNMISWFTRRTGLSPKLYSRICRFQNLIRSDAGEVRWSHLSNSHGYSDQAHMIRDFREFTGLTPERYRKANVEWKNHVPEPDL
ncbi:AraC-like DNA-binding protein [Bradyrhizobium sp. USDA 3240]